MLMKFGWTNTTLAAQHQVTGVTWKGSYWHANCYYCNVSPLAISEGGSCDLILNPNIHLRT